MVRQRMISSHGHLGTKLRGGVFPGHAQVLSSYQNETGIPLSNSGCSDALSPTFPQSKESLMYHCFKHRGMSSLLLGNNRKMVEKVGTLCKFEKE